jgi:hypothetical protein
MRRRDWLEARAAKKAFEGAVASYDEGELSAIKFALDVLFKRYGIKEEDVPLKRNM